MAAPLQVDNCFRPKNLASHFQPVSKFGTISANTHSQTSGKIFFLQKLPGSNLYFCKMMFFFSDQIYDSRVPVQVLPKQTKNYYKSGGSHCPCHNNPIFNLLLSMYLFLHFVYYLNAISNRENILKTLLTSVNHAQLFNTCFLSRSDWRLFCGIN